MRPAGVLPHGRSDCDTFCDHERYRVYRHGYRSRVEGRRRILVKGRSIDIAAFARHCDVMFGFVRNRDQRRGGREVYVGVTSGDIATCPFRKSRREHASLVARLPGGMEMYAIWRAADVRSEHVRWN